MAAKSTSNNKPERTNTGKRGSKKNPQNHGDLIRLGKGAFQSIPKLPGPAFAIGSGGPPWDAQQSKINKQMGYW